MDFTNPQPTPEEPAVSRPPPESAPPTPDAVNPKLTANLRADYEALQNDMQQAQEMAGDFQRQLAGKSNEFAQLKQVFEKTQKDLAHLEVGITELRAERHRLANDAMRAVALEVKLAKVTDERDKLRIEIETLRRTPTKNTADADRALRERDAMIATLVLETEALKKALVAAQSTGSRPADGRSRPAETRPPPPARESASSRNQVAANDDFIDISFEA
jgi:peptidoglycan hydrolase CwlO-like protein